MRCAGCCSIALRRFAAMPCGQCTMSGDAMPAFVREVLEPAEGRAAERRPVHAEIQVRVRTARRIAVEAAVRTGLGVGAVVRHEEDERVVERAARLEALHQRADCSVSIASTIAAYTAIRWSKRSFAFDQTANPRPAYPLRADSTATSHRSAPCAILPLVALLPQPVPAGLVLAAILGDQVRRRHQREVRRVERQVEKERFVGLARLVDELQSEVRSRGTSRTSSCRTRRASRGVAVPFEIQRLLRAAR